MSATIDQFKLIANCPKNIKTKQTVEFELAKHAPRNINGELTRRPTAQINGSACFQRTLSFCANMEPSGTPINPATIAMTPNL